MRKPPHIIIYNLKAHYHVYITFQVRISLHILRRRVLFVKIPAVKPSITIYAEHLTRQTQPLPIYMPSFKLTTSP